MVDFRLVFSKVFLKLSKLCCSVQAKVLGVLILAVSSFSLRLAPGLTNLFWP